uniref:Uncharacterized protein n=1 Tax=Ectopseudomonas oleovorans TaxID=301 RepID=A0A653BBG4_ECTOL
MSIADVSQTQMLILLLKNLLQHMPSPLSCQVRKEVALSQQAKAIQPTACYPEGFT